MSGKPYISTNSATINAENALKLRQSRAVDGLEKLNAKPDKHQRVQHHQPPEAVGRDGIMRHGRVSRGEPRGFRVAPLAWF